MSGVTSINHKTVYRDRLEPYTFPITEQWTNFVDLTPATWVGDPVKRQEFAALYGYGALEVAWRDYLVPEHKEAHYVASKVKYGGEVEVRDAGGIPSPGVPSWAGELLRNQMDILRRLTELLAR